MRPNRENETDVGAKKSKPIKTVVKSDSHGPSVSYLNNNTKSTVLNKLLRSHVRSLFRMSFSSSNEYKQSGYSTKIKYGGQTIILNET